MTPRLVWLGLFFTALVRAAPPPLIILDADQISHLGIRTTNAEPVAHIPLAMAPGRVVLPPSKEFVVSAFHAGIVRQIDVALGASVRLGQLMGEIDSIQLVDHERAVIAARATFEVAQARLKRDKTLLNEGVISRMRWQETRSDFEQARASLRAAEQTLMATGVPRERIRQLETGQGQISGLYPVLSPSEGVVLERMVLVGQRVDALAPLFRVGQLDTLWLEVDMPQERLQEARIGDQVTVETPKVRARIIEISQSVDPRSQTALVRALVEEGKERLRPGMYLNIQLMHNSADRGFRVPISALFSHEGRTYVFVQQSGGFEAREVAVAGQEPHGTVLHEGLEEGDRVVIQGIAGLKASWLDQQTTD